MRALLLLIVALAGCETHHPYRYSVPGDDKEMTASELEREFIGRSAILMEPADQPVRLVRFVPVKYPFDIGSRKGALSGSARLEFVIGEDGATREIDVASAAHPALGRACADAVRQWKFEPPMRANRAAAVKATYTCYFGGEKRAAGG